MLFFGIEPLLELTQQIEIRTDHPILDNANVVAGMSGSPIYLDNGRLAGAYAYGWPFGKDPVEKYEGSFRHIDLVGQQSDLQFLARIEIGGAGMVDPNVLKAVGYDPDEVSGFAFGLGIERFCMSRHQVTDIRRFYENDVRFLAQF